MRYIKLFENSDMQFGEVDSIFAEFTDNEEVGSINNDNESYIKISLYKDYLRDTANNMDDINSISNDYKLASDFINKLKIPLSRIEYLGYDWTLEILEGAIIIKILREPRGLSLYDAFGGIFNMRTVEPGIIKRVMKEKYNLKYSSFDKREGTSGYYGKRSEINIYFMEKIPTKTHDLTPNHPLYIAEDHQILKDLKELERRNERYPDERPQRAFYSVRAHNWERFGMIVLELQ